MANTSEGQDHGAQSDRAQEWKPNSGNGRKLRLCGLIFMFGAVVVGVMFAAGILIFGSGETTGTVSHVGDSSNTMRMSHLLLTEWEVTGLNSNIAEELKAGESNLELHNDGQTVHRLSIWRGGEVLRDQVVGGTLVAETGYIQPGEFTTLDIVLKPGGYVLLCSVRGHAARGMYATLQLQ